MMDLSFFSSFICDSIFVDLLMASSKATVCRTLVFSDASIRAVCKIGSKDPRKSVTLASSIDMLLQKERHAMKKDISIIILPADKGRVTVILNRS